MWTSRPDYGGQGTMRLTEEEDESTIVEADVSKAAGVTALAGMTLKVHGGLDYAFDKAGIEGPLTTGIADPSTARPGRRGQPQRCVALYEARYPHMLRQGGASIIKNSSVAGLVHFESDFTCVAMVGRMGSPGEAAEVVVWLCSGAASSK